MITRTPVILLICMLASQTFTQGPINEEANSNNSNPDNNVLKEAKGAKTPSDVNLNDDDEENSVEIPVNFFQDEADDEINEDKVGNDKAEKLLVQKSESETKIETDGKINKDEKHSSNAENEEGKLQSKEGINPEISNKDEEINVNQKNYDSESKSVSDSNVDNEFDQDGENVKTKDTTDDRETEKSTIHEEENNVINKSSKESFLETETNHKDKMEEYSDNNENQKAVSVDQAPTDDHLTNSQNNSDNDDEKLYIDPAQNENSSTDSKNGKWNGVKSWLSKSKDMFSGFQKPENKINGEKTLEGEARTEDLKANEERLNIEPTSEEYDKKDEEQIEHKNILEGNNTDEMTLANENDNEKSNGELTNTRSEEKNQEDNHKKGPIDSMKSWLSNTKNIFGSKGEKTNNMNENSFVDEQTVDESEKGNEVSETEAKLSEELEQSNNQGNISLGVTESKTDDLEDNHINDIQNNDNIQENEGDNYDNVDKEINNELEKSQTGEEKNKKWSLDGVTSWLSKTKNKFGLKNEKTDGVESSVNDEQIKEEPETLNNNQYDDNTNDNISNVNENKSEKSVNGVNIEETDDFTGSDSDIDNEMNEHDDTLDSNLTESGNQLGNIQSDEEGGQEGKHSNKEEEITISNENSSIPEKSDIENNIRIDEENGDQKGIEDNDIYNLKDSNDNIDSTPEESNDNNNGEIDHVDDEIDKEINHELEKSQTEEVKNKNWPFDGVTSWLSKTKNKFGLKNEKTDGIVESSENDKQIKEEPETLNNNQYDDNTNDNIANVHENKSEKSLNDVNIEETDDYTGSDLDNEMNEHDDTLDSNLTESENQFSNIQSDEKGGQEDKDSNKEEDITIGDENSSMPEKSGIENKIKIDEENSDQKGIEGNDNYNLKDNNDNTDSTPEESDDNNNGEIESEQETENNDVHTNDDGNILSSQSVKLENSFEVPVNVDIDDKLKMDDNYETNIEHNDNDIENDNSNSDKLKEGQEENEVSWPLSGVSSWLSKTKNKLLPKNEKLSYEEVKGNNEHLSNANNDSANRGQSNEITPTESYNDINTNQSMLETTENETNVQTNIEEEIPTKQSGFWPFSKIKSFVKRTKDKIKSRLSSKQGSATDNNVGDKGGVEKSAESQLDTTKIMETTSSMNMNNDDLPIKHGSQVVYQNDPESVEGAKESMVLEILGDIPPPTETPDGSDEDNDAYSKKDTSKTDEEAHNEAIKILTDHDMPVVQENTYINDSHDINDNEASEETNDEEDEKLIVPLSDTPEELDSINEEALEGSSSIEILNIDNPYRVLMKNEYSRTAFVVFLKNFSTVINSEFAMRMFIGLTRHFKNTLKSPEGSESVLIISNKTKKILTSESTQIRANNVYKLLKSPNLSTIIDEVTDICQLILSNPSSKQIFRSTTKFVLPILGEEDPQKLLVDKFVGLRMKLDDMQIP